jgi:hypothetical protein
MCSLIAVICAFGGFIGLFMDLFACSHSILINFGLLSSILNDLCGNYYTSDLSREVSVH